MRALDFSPDGRWVASGGHDGLVKLWDWKSNAIPNAIRTLRGHSYVVNAVKFVLEGASNPQWQVRELLTLSAHQNVIEDLQFSPSRDLLASSDASGVVRLWRAVPEQD